MLLTVHSSTVRDCTVTELKVCAAQTVRTSRCSVSLISTWRTALSVLHVMFEVVGKIKQMGNSVRTFCLSGLGSSVPPTALQLDNRVIQAAAAAAAEGPPVGLRGSLLWSLSATASGHHGYHSCSDKIVIH